MKVRTIKAKKVSAILHYSKKLRKVLHKILLKIRKKHEQKLLHYSICSGVDAELCQLGEPICGVFNSKIKNTLYELFKVWPEFSGNECFPVPSYSTWCDENEAFWSLDRWYEGEY